MYRLCGVLTLTLMALVATEARAFDFSSAVGEATTRAKNAAVGAAKGQLVPVDCAQIKHSLGMIDGKTKMYKYSFTKTYNSDARVESVTVDGTEFPVQTRGMSKPYHDKGENWECSPNQIKVQLAQPAKTMVFKFGVNACTMDFPAPTGKSAKLPTGVMRP